MSSGYVKYIDGKRIFFAPNGSGSGGASFNFGQDDETEVNIPKVEMSIDPAPTFEQNLKNYGYTDAEVIEIKKRLADADAINSTVDSVTSTDSHGQTSTNAKGSLVSNSAQSLQNTALYQKSRLEIEKAKLDAINYQNQINQKQLDSMDASLVMQSLLLGQIQDLTNATKAQKLNPTFQAGQTNVTLDTSALSTATQALANGVADQTATNAKIVENLTKHNEHLDYLKNGDSSLKDSSGSVVKPREVEAKNNAENHIYKHAENTHDHQVAMLEVLNHLNGMSNVGDGSGTGSGSSGGAGGAGGAGSNKDDLLSIFDALVSFNYEKWKEEQDYKIFKDGSI